MYEEHKIFSENSVIECKAIKIKVVLNLQNHYVWRELLIPLNTKFIYLHEILQTVFGWKCCHLHDFYILSEEEEDNYMRSSIYNNKKYKRVVNLISDEEAFDYNIGVPMILQGNKRLSEYKLIEYNYDFGDGWKHLIEVEEVIEDCEKNYPICIGGAGNTPPEDVGGSYGYDEFLEIINDKTHPEYEEMLEWGKSQGYKDFDIEHINRMLKWDY